MLPLRDNIRSSSFPIVNVAIIVVCAIVFLFQAFTPGHLIDWAFKPRELVSLTAIAGQGLGVIIEKLFASIFMHGGFLHIGVNMLFLWVFGDNVEDRMGHWRYLLFYLACGVVGNLAHALLSGFSPQPIVGASGAIAGVMGAYFVLFRFAMIRTFALIIFFPIVFDLPAPIFLVYWFILQLFMGVGTIGLATGVAVWAHVGGFASGYLLAQRLARPLLPPPDSRTIRPRVVHMRID